MTNTLAYYKHMQIMTVKSFIVQALELKTFLVKMNIFIEHLSKFILTEQKILRMFYAIKSCMIDF